MEKIKCPKCNADIDVSIENAIDAEGEVFMCPNCGFDLRFTQK